MYLTNLISLASRAASFQTSQPCSFIPVIYLLWKPSTMHSIPIAMIRYLPLSTLYLTLYLPLLYLLL